VKVVRGSQWHEKDHMKKTKRARTATTRKKAHAVAADKPRHPTRKRLEHIAEDVMGQERRDRRALDRQAERKARKARKPETTRSGG
jgi:hypothetical protein